jgi:3-hydroxyisobutyrate dehydrogenase-like beta-hydroxyacid dehydrogenase
VLARQAGVSVEALLTTMDGGSSDSTMRALKGEPMLAHDFTPLFKLAHMLKDVELCLAEARTAGGAFPFAGLAAELYGAGIGRGLGDQDFSAVLEVVEGITGTRL